MVFKLISFSRKINIWKTMVCICIHLFFPHPIKNSYILSDWISRFSDDFMFGLWLANNWSKTGGLGNSRGFLSNTFLKTHIYSIYIYKWLLSLFSCLICWKAYSTHSQGQMFTLTFWVKGWEAWKLLIHTALTVFLPCNGSWKYCFLSGTQTFDHISPFLAFLLSVYFRIHFKNSCSLIFSSLILFLLLFY